jgi:hypothetical protein
VLTLYLTAVLIPSIPGVFLQSFRNLTSSPIKESKVITSNDALFGLQLGLIFEKKLYHHGLLMIYLDKFL